MAYAVGLGNEREEMEIAIPVPWGHIAGECPHLKKKIRLQTKIRYNNFD